MPSHFLLFILLVVGACGLAPSPVSADDAASVIDVGSRKQLFIDDRFIESSEGVRLVMNPPRRDGRVLLRADQPWEQGRNIGIYSSVLEEDGRIRVWYGLRRPTPGGDYRYELRVCYAESEDGLHFEKPRLGLHEVDGSTENNVVMPGPVGGGSVWIDPHAPPEQRYKSQAKYYLGKNHLRLYSSPDGVHWSRLATMKPGVKDCDTQSIVFWDPRYNRYAMYTRLWIRPGTETARYRTVRRLESDNLIDWDNQAIVMKADEIDLATHHTPTDEPPVDYYGAYVFRYEQAEDVYIMLAEAFWHWQQRENAGLGPSSFDVRLAVSRDGKHFERAGGRLPFLANGPDGSFDSRMVWAMPHLVQMGDELWIYYVGTNRDHDYVVDKAGGGQHLSGISRAVMRLDGFVSADAGYEGGQLTTPPIRFSGERLELNIETHGGGAVAVEILDENGAALPGYTRDDSVERYGNSVNLPMIWRGGDDVSALAGRAVRLRFHLQDCKLYAFQFR